ncbi:hAT dimerization domain, ribonuclease H-like domain protein [Tanacetum coccineum]
MASQEETQQETQDQPPLWEYVTKLEKQGASGGVWKFQCNLCSETRQGSYSRVRAHLLGQPSSSSCVERNWSTYAFIHSLRRNKLTTSCAQDLVYIHNNLRLLSRNPNNDVKIWDVGGDAFGFSLIYF